MKQVCFRIFVIILYSLIILFQSLLGQEKKRVIVNLDTGLDDGYALLLLLYAEKVNLVQVEAVVCSQGNTNITNVVRNTVRLLELANRTNIPIHKGVDDPIILRRQYASHSGLDGFGDLVYNDEPPVEIVEPRLAALGLRDLVTTNPGEISLLCLAPLTDVAITSKLYSDFFNNLKDIWILGGNFRKSTVEGRSAEFNFLCDPEAAHIVFENDLRKKIYMLTLETYRNLSTITYDWRYNVLPNKTQIMSLITKAERSLGHEKSQALWNPPDAFLAYCFLQPQFCGFDPKMRTVRIELHDTLERAWVKFDDVSTNNSTKNVQLVESLHQQEFQKYMLEAASAV